MENLRFVNCRPLFIAKFQGIFHLLAKSERVYGPLFEFHISSVPSSTRWINKIDTSSYCFYRRSMFTFSRFQKSSNVAPFLSPKFIFPFVHRFLVLNSFFVRFFFLYFYLFFSSTLRYPTDALFALFLPTIFVYPSFHILSTWFFVFA